MKCCRLLAVITLEQPPNDVLFMRTSFVFENESLNDEISGAAKWLDKGRVFRRNGLPDGVNTPTAKLQSNCDWGI